MVGNVVGNILGQQRQMRYANGFYRKQYRDLNNSDYESDIWILQSHLGIAENAAWERGMTNGIETVDIHLAPSQFNLLGLKGFKRIG